MSDRCGVMYDGNGLVRGWVCSLSIGHSGDHAAHRVHDLAEPPRVTWPQGQGVGPTNISVASLADLETCLKTLQDMK